MAASRSPSALGPAALVAGGTGFLAAVATWARGADFVGHTLSGPGAAQVTLATAFVPLSFAALTAAWLGFGRALSERLLRAAVARRVVLLGRLALSWLLLALPGYAVALALTHGTSAFRPGRTEWHLAAGVIAGAPVALLALEFAARGLARSCARRPKLTLAALVTVSLAAFVTWAMTTASLRERYGATQLLSFGLITAGVTLLFSVGLESAQRLRPTSGGRAGWLLALTLVASAGALLSPASPAVVAHFHAERPARWFARALVPALPDADGDGTPANLGLLRGGDCDDENPARHPFARDLPANGVDENCFHDDAKRHDGTSMLHAVTAREPHASPRNLVLVVIDSLRFDRRFANGIDGAVTPALASLATGSTTFSAFRTCSPRTRESVPDLLGAGPELSGPRGMAAPNAVEALAKQGVQTAFIASEWLARYAHVRGFELARLEPSRYGHFADSEVAAEVRAFLREPHRRPFFLFTHWLGAHEPYAGEAACLAAAASDRARYDCALAALDRELASLLATLEERNLLGGTVVAVTADHGEEFGEHGGRYHATTLYDEVLRVPLVVRVPGRSGELVHTPVGCGDLMRTLLRAAGHRDGIAPYGRDALAAPSDPAPQLARTRRAGASLFEPRAYAVAHRHHKLLFDAASGVLTYFDLARDPFERAPLASVDPALERELLEAMDAWLSAQVPASGAERAPVLAAR